MSSEWKTVEVGDVCSVGDGAHSKVSRQTEGVLYLTSKNIGRGGLKLDNVDYISQENFDRLFPTSSKATRRPRPGDILIGIIGTFGNAYIYKSSDSFGFASSIGILRPDAILLNSEYLYYVITSRNFQVKHANYNAGSVQGYTNIPTIKKLSLPLPPLEEQVRIAGILKALDDRISLLRETNATLEAVAQALFKSWFVDFDPVRAKQEGRAPEGMDDATAALFPDGFEESELRLVPKGWRVGSIYEIAKVTYGAPFASSLFKTERVGRPLIRIRDLKDESPGIYTEEIHPRGYLVQPGEIVVGMDGEFRAYLWGGEPAWLNQRLCLFSPLGNASTAFVRHSLIPLLAAVEASETATTVIHLGKNDIDRFKVCIPDDPVLKVFGEISNAIYKKIVESKQAASTLATLRDTLLPRLISGQLRLPEAEATVASAL